MQFEYDDNKSQSNLAKHGIDFVAAQELWDVPYVEVQVWFAPPQAGGGYL
jgi:uncharacterized DUF497 family protein